MNGQNKQAQKGGNDENEKKEIFLINLGWKKHFQRPIL